MVRLYCIVLQTQNVYCVWNVYFVWNYLPSYIDEGFWIDVGNDKNIEVKYSPI